MRFWNETRSSKCDENSAVLHGEHQFVYSVGLLGVTGERAELALTATVLAARVKKITNKPVLIGVGVSNALQAVEASRVADGVIMGASVVNRMMDGGSEAVGLFVAEVRAALDGATW